MENDYCITYPLTTDDILALLRGERLVIFPGTESRGGVAIRRLDLDDQPILNGAEADSISRIT